jgi:hypothetical protein
MRRDCHLQPRHSAPAAAPSIHRGRLSVALVALAAGWVLLVTPLHAAAERFDLSGVWAIDPELSETPTEGVPERGGHMHGPGGMPGGPGGMPGGPGGGPGGGRGSWGRGSGPGGGGDGAEDSRKAMRQRMEQMRKRLESLEIAADEATVAIRFADDSELELTTDNEKRTVDTPIGEATVKARWSEGSLVVETESERHKTTETYVVTTDRSLLTVVVETSGGGPMGSRSYKRFYRPVDASQADPADDSE